ncbi:MAG: glycoside hydrolase family 95 protein [Blautia sp.]|nr:glycoside hydrolase family 95 protein [Blautia sp.]
MSVSELYEKSPLTLWYRQPSREGHQGWEEDALPIGNGELGCKIFGGIRRERIQFNEKSLWSGSTLGEGGNSNGNKNGDFGESLRRIRKLLARKNYAEARENMTRLQGDETGLGAYQSFGDLFLEFTEPGMDAADVTEYERGLSLEDGTAWVRYRRQEQIYERSCFASFPAQAAVFRLHGNFTEVRIRMDIHQKLETIDRTVDGICLSGQVAEKDAAGLRFAVTLRVKSDGEQTVCGEELVITHASEICMYLAAATDYGWEYPRYRRKAKITELVSDRTEQAVQKGYDRLYQEHLQDYVPLFSRVSLELGQEPNTIPADALLASVQNGQESRLLEVLLFQYGRYLILSSSRAGGLPANLQGVWNDQNAPAWQSDYHLNINLQMNYWLSLNTNLPETMLPLFSYINQCLVIPGRETAWRYTGIGDGDSHSPTGWMTHTQNNIFGHTGPGSDWRWGWAPAVGAFLLQNTFDYYRFTQDIDMLEKEIYPAMEECARLWSQLLTEDEETGELLCSPCFSPEHGPVTAGNTFDETMVWQLYHDVLEASDALCAGWREYAVDKNLIALIRAQFPRIIPCTVGDWGQIREWREEDTWKNRGFDDQDVQDRHRHFSHLMGVYPGQYINAQRPELMEAARISMRDRGEEGPSWSMALRIGVWARLLDGNAAFHALQSLIRHNTMNNLWGYHPPFQIDGNLGLSAGIGEMLLQSHDHCIHILPALPDAWKREGSFQGLLARGNITVDAQWKQGKIRSIRLRSGSDSQFLLRFADQEKEICMRDGEERFFEL